MFGWRSDRCPPIMGKVKYLRPTPLGASWGFKTFFVFNRLVLRNWFTPRHRPSGSCWHRRLTYYQLQYSMDAMGTPDPPRPPRSVGEVLGTGRLFDKIVGALSARFWSTGEKGGHYRQSSGQGRDTRLPQAPRLRCWPVPRTGAPCPARGRPGRNSACPALIIFHPVGPYSTSMCPLDFIGELPQEVYPPINDLYVASSVVWRAIFSLLREYRQVHVEVTPPYSCQSAPYERSGKHTDNSKDLAWQRLTVFPPILYDR